jgi:2-hydroxy-6-oxonona-2,4-dienedioate hydrolase
MFTEQSTSRTLDFEGDLIHFHDVGRGEPLIMPQAFGPVPGTTAWLSYSKLLPALSQDFRCVLIDYPNFGRSSSKLFHEPVHDLYARQAFAVMDELGIESADLLGSSTGGTVALDMALTERDRVNRIVLGSCEASTGGDSTLLAPSPSEVARLFDECQAHPADRARIRRLLEGIVHDQALVTDQLVEAMHELRVAEPEHADTYARSQSVPRSNLVDLRTLEIPCLIIHGRHDRMVPVEQALRLLSSLPSADLVVLERCGHWPAFERPEAFIRFALPFLVDR